MLARRSGGMTDMVISAVRRQIFDLASFISYQLGRPRVGGKNSKFMGRCSPWEG